MKALVVVSGAVNYYYNLTGQRLAEALRELGCEVDLHTVRDEPSGEYDWCFWVNITELVASCPTRTDAMYRLSRLRAQSRIVASVLLDAVDTEWFVRACALSQEAGGDLILDLGLHDQSCRVQASVAPLYRFAFNGLTATERREVEARPWLEVKRPIPWAFIGHVTESRVHLVRRLIEEVDAAGFVYLPRLGPVTDDGPHLNERQYRRVLEHAGYQVWCSHHTGFYLEGERFRLSLRSGATPIKMLLTPPDHGVAFPFSYLLLDIADGPQRLRQLDRYSLQRRFIEEFLSLPSLANSLAQVLAERGQ